MYAGPAHQTQLAPDQVVQLLHLSSNIADAPAAARDGVNGDLGGNQVTRNAANAAQELQEKDSDAAQNDGHKVAAAGESTCGNVVRFSLMHMTALCKASRVRSGQVSTSESCCCDGAACFATHHKHDCAGPVAASSYPSESQLTGGKCFFYLLAEEDAEDAHPHGLHPMVCI